MGFRRAHGTPNLMWFPVDATDTLYRGQLVKSTSDGVAPLGAASGANDATGDANIVGIVVGDNNMTPVYDSTYKTYKITAVATQALLAARDTILHKMAPKGDKRAMVLVDVIDPLTWIYGPIFNAAYGTAPSLLTATVASTDGGVTAPTTNACDFTPVADLCTIYCRSGANAGQDRVTTDTSTTQPTVTHAFMEDIAVGDTFVRVPLRTGWCYMQTEATESMYINAAASPATDYWTIFVKDLILAEAGKEHAIFRFAHTVHAFA
jgi:hypothetical protein